MSKKEKAQLQSRKVNEVILALMGFENQTSDIPGTQCQVAYGYHEGEPVPMQASTNKRLYIRMCEYHSNQKWMFWKKIQL